VIGSEKSKNSEWGIEKSKNFKLEINEPFFLKKSGEGVPIKN